MRFLISLQREGSGSILPINYQYELSSLIYRIIDRADSAFSEFLHRQGYVAYGKNFRLFTFSRLKFDRYQVIPGSDRLVHEGDRASFEISFLVDRAAEEFIKGLFLDQRLVLGDKLNRVSYHVSQIAAKETPNFREIMRYRCLSPLFIRRKRDEGGEDYLRPDDRDFGILLMRNLQAKNSAFVAQADGEVMVRELIPDFSFTPLGKVYQNGVLIKQHTPYQTKLIAYLFEFQLRAPVELQEIGYYGGFGHLGSQGFGCVGVKGGAI